MLARGVDVVAGRVVLDELDIGDQRRARVRAFEQIVAQYLVLGDAALERVLDGVDVVYALAGESAVAERICPCR
jgi:hypothetical protein